MYVFAKRAIILTMNSGDRIKIIHNGAEEMKRIYSTLCLSVLQHVPCSINVSDTKLEVSRS